MKNISFDPFRTLGIPNTSYVKPELIFKEREIILNANWILFPEYWQVNLLHYAWKKKIFPSINSYHLGHNKVEMTRAIKGVLPEHLPYTRILPNNELAKNIILEEFSYPFVAKEIRNSMGKGVYLITNQNELEQYLKSNDILYIQEYLEIDRDMRIVYVGSGAIAGYWRINEGSFKNNVAQGGRIDYSPIPREAIDLVEKLAETLGINHAGFDVAIHNNHLYFFEFNIMFGNQALNLAGIDIPNTIHEYINRVDEPEPPQPLMPDKRAS